VVRPTYVRSVLKDKEIPILLILSPPPQWNGESAAGPNIANGYRQARVDTGLILNGANPATLPVVPPTQFLLYLNIRTAKTLGLQIPPLLLALVRGGHYGQRSREPHK